MDLKKLLGLRPKTDTAKDIADAIAMAEAERAAALTRITELERGRGELILTGDAKTVEAGERELAELRAEAERLGVLATALKPQLEAAKVREKATEIADLARSAEQHVERFLTWWKTEYPGLAERMRDGFRMEAAALRAIRELHECQSQQPAAFAASGATIPVTPANRLYPGHPDNVISSVTGGARLMPPVGKARPKGNADPFWPEYEIY